MQQLRAILNFLPVDQGAVGDVLQRGTEGATWQPLTSVVYDIDGMSPAAEVTSSDELPIYDVSAQGNYKVTVQDLLDLAAAAPVSSVNGQTGTVVLDASDVGALPDTTTIPSDTSDLTNTAGFVDAAGAAAAAPVQSVSGRTGAVVLGKSDVGLGNVDNVQQYSASNPPPYPVTSVNGQTGDVSIPVINPPDFLNSIRVLQMTSGTLYSFVSTGGWYQMRAVNRGSSGACWASICNSDQSAYYALADVGTGTYIRAITEWLYIPANETVYARGEFTYPDQSGLFYAAPLS